MSVDKNFKLRSPVIVELNEHNDFPHLIRDEIKLQAKDKSNLLLTYPVVYIHEWKNTKNKDLFDIYIGESNDVIQRTREHYNSAREETNWQNNLLNTGFSPTMYVIGHEHFNKSLTLDIENKLIDYVWFMRTVSKVHNSRGNQQNDYYLSSECDEIFSLIWKGLRKKNKQLFVSEAEIKDSAIFKASPLHKLNEEQLEAKRIITEKVQEAIKDSKTNQLIFVQGEAGTGKTVLMSSTFYDLLENQIDLFGRPIKCAILVNHDEQITVYEEIAKKLNPPNYFKTKLVSKPTHFINYTDKADPYGIVFVDEGHLLLTQGKQAYRGKNHLDDIMERSRVTVIIFDENQILTSEEYWEDKVLEEKINLSKSQNNFIHLEKQMRMNCAHSTLNFINDLTLNKLIKPLPYDDSYEIKVFDNPNDLYMAIKNKGNKENSRLSRMLATYDWDYDVRKKPNNGEKYWGVRIGNFFMPWNRELSKELTKKEKHKNKNLAWAEQKQTINEVGSTFTIQGFDLSYAGVIIGPSVVYRNGVIDFDPSKSKNNKATQNRTLSNNSKKSFAKYFLQHELRVLLTRGVNGLYIYAVDKELNDALKKAINQN